MLVALFRVGLRHFSKKKIFRHELHLTVGCLTGSAFILKSIQVRKKTNLWMEPSKMSCKKKKNTKKWSEVKLQAGCNCRFEGCA